MEANLQSQASLCGICGGESETEAGFSPSTSVFPYQLLFHRCFILSSIIRGEDKGDIVA
jgi:hypothetical protein